MKKLCFGYRSQVTILLSLNITQTLATTFQMLLFLRNSSMMRVDLLMLGLSFKSLDIFPSLELDIFAQSFLNNSQHA